MSYPLMFPVVASTQPMPGTESQPVDAECLPACGEGYVCAQGTCVSACNPPCEAGERCTAAAQCEPVQAAPAPLPPIVPAEPSWGPEPAPVAAPAPLGTVQVAPTGAQPTVHAAAEAPPAPEGWVLVPRLAVRIGGSGELSEDCSGPACDGEYYYHDDLGALDYDDASSAAIGLDVLYHVGRSFRIGGAVSYVFTDEIDMKLPFGYEELGSDLSLVAILEGLFRVGPASYLAARGQIGPSVLLPGGDLERRVDLLKDTCQRIMDRGGEDCSVAEGPYLGLVYGAGIGYVHALDVLRLRLDLVLEARSTDTVSISASNVYDPYYSHDLEGDYTTTTSLSGTRWWLAGGLEL